MAFAPKSGLHPRKRWSASTFLLPHRTAVRRINITALSRAARMSMGFTQWFAAFPVRQRSGRQVPDFPWWRTVWNVSCTAFCGALAWPGGGRDSSVADCGNLATLSFFIGRNCFSHARGGANE
jgi:hypothetical protein